MTAVPVLDLTVPPAAVLRRAVRAIEIQHQRGGAVLVCCALGMSRSAAAAAAWLLASRRAQHLDEALLMVRAARPQVVLRPSWMNVIACTGKIQLSKRNVR